MKKPKIVIFDDENNSVICEEPLAIVAFLCNKGEVKTVVCGDVDDNFVNNLADCSSMLIKETLNKGTN